MAFWIPVILGAWFVYDILDIGSYLVTGDGILETALGDGSVATVIVEYVPGMTWVDFLQGHILALLIIGALCVAGLYILMKPRIEKGRKRKRV